MEFRIKRAPRIEAEITVPGDKSISHRAVIIGGLTNGVCGNSATPMRLLAGLLAGQSFDSVLVGGATLSGRPMERVILPLRKMGANIMAQGPNETAPVKIHGMKLRGASHVLPIASAQVKSAVLLAGLFAKGKTTVREPFLSRNHTELMLNYFLVRTVREEND